MNSPRPLSPHLGVYKFMYTMALSILHRITGIAAGFGFLALVWWLMALATGPDASAMSHHTNTRKPTAAAQPVIRCRIDSDIVYANLYTPRCGDSGRWFMR